MNFHNKHLSLLFLGHYIMHTSIFLLNSASKLNKVMIINTGTCIHGPKLVEMNSLICKCVIFYIYIKMNYINLYIYVNCRRITSCAKCKFMNPEYKLVLVKSCNLLLCTGFYNISSGFFYSKCTAHSS